ncbi:MAG: type I-C CRISPR-associated protein Cas5 [Hungateiclostridium thermocellum]|nr:type I-C CRISPR-associated protein Cas5 [Acetivibrio thermocellus]
MRNEITYKVYGRYALFTDPVTKIGAEKMSLTLPTYQALKGITESIYFKPTISWVIDSVRIMKPIKTESKAVRTLNLGGGNDLSYYTYLSDVEYHVKAHFEFNLNRPDLADDRNEHKHYCIAKRSIERGGRRDIFLGSRECQAYVEPCEFDAEEGYYDSMGEMEFGLQYHSIVYPDEQNSSEMTVKFWYPKMVNGVINFCRPEECPKERVISKMIPKKFTKGINFALVDDSDLLEEIPVKRGNNT